MYGMLNVSGKIGTLMVGGVVLASTAQDVELGREPRLGSSAVTIANQPVRTGTDHGTSDEITRTPHKL